WFFALSAPIQRDCSALNKTGQRGFFLMNDESSVYAGFCPPGWVRFNMSRAALWYERMVWQGPT
ncbi:hypothetical protein, partial [Klebsiella grimontii]|uniref:hypothetical protein n=1 Tax=Klebsiella grimontii TaxID=2058152 RepID=UPI001C49C4CB